MDHHSSSPLEHKPYLGCFDVPAPTKPHVDSIEGLEGDWRRSRSHHTELEADCSSGLCRSRPGCHPTSILRGCLHLRGPAHEARHFGLKGCFLRASGSGIASRRHASAEIERSQFKPVNIRLNGLASQSGDQVAVKRGRSLFGALFRLLRFVEAELKAITGISGIEVLGVMIEVAATGTCEDQQEEGPRD